MDTTSYQKVHCEIKEMEGLSEALLALHEMRRKFCTSLKLLLEGAGFPEEMVCNIIQAVGEGIFNVRHAYSEHQLKIALTQPESISATAYISPSRVCVIIRDDGPNGTIQEVPDSQNDLWSERGRGILMMKALTNFSIIANEPGHHSIQLVVYR